MSGLWPSWRGFFLGWMDGEGFWLLLAVGWKWLGVGSTFELAYIINHLLTDRPDSLSMDLYLPHISSRPSIGRWAPISGDQRAWVSTSVISVGGRVCGFTNEQLPDDILPGILTLLISPSARWLTQRKHQCYSPLIIDSTLPGLLGGVIDPSPPSAVA